MSTIWGIESGSYSDYQVDAMFSTREKAEAYLSEYVKIIPDARLGKWELDPEPPVAIVGITVYMAKDGTHQVGHVRQYDSVRHTIGFDYYWAGNMHWTVATDDPERAVKAVNEKRTQALALNVWGNDELTKELVR